MQAQIQALVAAQAGEVVAVEISQPNTRSSINIAKPLIFNGKVSKVSGFLTACRLFIRIKMRNNSVKEQYHKINYSLICDI